MASPVAFDLVLAPSGAVLVWATPEGSLRGQLYGERAEARGEPFEIGRAEKVLEVSAAAVGPRIGVAWVARNGTVAGTLGDLDVRRFNPRMSLGTIRFGNGRGRGHVRMLATDDGALLAMYRAGVSPCADGSSEECAEFQFAELHSTGVKRRGLPLLVPKPCGGGIAAFASAGGRRFYGVCSEREETRSTTVFMIQFQPEYAQTNEVLKQCSPRGSTVIDDEVVVVGDCASGRRAIRFGGGDLPIGSPLLVDRPELVCDRNRPLLRVSKRPKYERRLARATGDLEPLLDETLAPRQSRAVWTGSALLVAVSLGDRVALHGHQCRRGELVRVTSGGPS